MSTGVFFLIEAIFYLGLLMIIYFRKKIFKSKENKVYSILIIVTFIELLTEIILDFVGPMYQEIPKISYFIARIYCSFIILWNCLLCTYFFIVALKVKKKDNYINTAMTMLISFGIALSIASFLLPIKFFYSEGASYTYGASVNVVYVSAIIYSLVGLFCLIWNIKGWKDKRFIPEIILVTLGSACSYIQYTNPSLLLATAVHSFITFIMYFTIENPDMKLLDEVHRSKEISDNANEEKTLFLYNMTQEIRNTTSDINENADIIIDSNDLELDKNCAREIKGITSKFNSMTNEILDVSKLDSSSIKVYNSKYNIKNILKEIVTKYSDIVKNKELDFRVNIDHDIPEVLYGDSIGLKNVLCTIIDNSVKYTKSGYIEFNVNTIIKNDICRLIITIEDSGMGIKSDDINKIKISNKSLGKALKLITLMNGTMLISSNYGYGTKVKVILDQKIDIVKNEDISKYEEVYDNINILMVDDSESGIKIIEKLIRGTNIKMDSALNGKECLDKIKTSKYDVILLDEQLSQISAVELIKKIKLIRNFNTPVILLTKDNSYEYNDSYIKEGFSNYILKPVKKDDLLNKIKKDK